MTSCDPTRIMVGVVDRAQLRASCARSASRDPRPRPSGRTCAPEPGPAGIALIRLLGPGGPGNGDRRRGRTHRPGSWSAGTSPSCSWGRCRRAAPTSAPGPSGIPPGCPDQHQPSDHVGVTDRQSLGHEGAHRPTENVGRRDVNGREPCGYGVREPIERQPALHRGGSAQSGVVHDDHPTMTPEFGHQGGVPLSHGRCRAVEKHEGLTVPVPAPSDPASGDGRRLGLERDRRPGRRRHRAGVGRYRGGWRCRLLRRRDLRRAGA